MLPVVMNAAVLDTHSWSGRVGFYLGTRKYVNCTGGVCAAVVDEVIAALRVMHGAALPAAVAVSGP